MTQAAQDLAEKAVLDVKTASAKLNLHLQQILRIEQKRNEMAGAVATRVNDANFNLVFDYMIQAHYRRPEGLNQETLFPLVVKNLLYGRQNPNLNAYWTLKRMTVDVLKTANQNGPLQTVRMLKIQSTALLIPPFKPALQAWQAEAMAGQNRPQPRLPSSVGMIKEPANWPTSGDIPPPSP